MKKIHLLPILLLILLCKEKSGAQALACNDLVMISVDENCTHTITPPEILEGTIFDNCIVELDRTAPFGNGPWTSPTIDAADVNNTYLVRVKHVPSGNACWGNVHIEDKIAPVMECEGLTTVDIANGAPVSLAIGDVAAIITDGCTLAGNIVTRFEANQTALTWDCNDVGVHVITITATDASGNSATCQTTVLVREDGACAPCLDACPPPVTVSLNEGYNVLRPAFLAGNWNAFDTYGNPVFDPVCTYQDSVYTIEYHPSTAGQSWFLRKWSWNNALGQPEGVCEQPILFAGNQTIMVDGHVFAELSGNCSPDVGEPGINWFTVEALKLPSGTTQVVQPAGDGAYSLNIDMTPLDSAVIVHVVLPPGFASICPSALSIPYNSGQIQYTFDIGLQTEGDCPSMQVNLSALRARRCAANQYVVQYCNLGLDTAFNAYVNIHFDPLMELQSATHPYTALPNNTYIFNLGTVPPAGCGTFNMNVFFNCDVAAGETLCAEATAYPNIPCDGPWAGPVVTASADCLGDSVSLALWNMGAQDMNTPLDFIVIEDFIMRTGGSFLLNSGDSMRIMVPANGATWRIEAEQQPNFFVPGIVSAANEGCGGLNIPGLINAFSLNEGAIFVDNECVVTTGSYDPNDKSAVPTGYGADNTIRANESIEYKIRFQNTGTDTAFRVVIVDTLSALLDPFTFETGVASHPYRIDVFANGIIHFNFDPITLPDSNHNEAASHGFVQFRVAQKPDLPDGTIIENTASIYFDDNAPVVTNTVHHTIGSPYLVLDSQTPHQPGVQVNLLPNPFHEQATLEVKGLPVRNGLLSLYDTQGRLIREQTLRENRTIIYRGDLRAGMYFFTITTESAILSSGKIQVY